MDKGSKILVLGANGMLGSAIVRTLSGKGYNNIIKIDRNDLNLIYMNNVKNYFNSNSFDYIFFAAAKVGSIQANIVAPADFFLQNLQMQNNVIQASYESNVKKLIFIGSSNAYPKNCKQPISEEDLLTGVLEPSNEAYSLAKIAGLKMCQYFNQQYKTNYISAMPCNLYGYGDHYDSINAHVISALISKFHNAKINNLEQVEVWGTGEARREFLFVDDAADAIVFLMQNYNDSRFVNIGAGNDISIKELAYIIKKVIFFKGDVVFNTSKPEGMMKKLLDVTKMKNLGWSHSIELEQGIQLSYANFLKENIANK